MLMVDCGNNRIDTGELGSMMENERIAPNTVELSKIIGRLIMKHCRDAGQNSDALAAKLNVSKDYVRTILRDGTFTFQELLTMCGVAKVKLRALFDEAAETARAERAARKTGTTPKAGAPSAARKPQAGNAGNAGAGSHEHAVNTVRTAHNANNANSGHTGNTAGNANSVNNAGNVNTARKRDAPTREVKYHDATPPSSTELQPVNDSTPDEPPFTITATEAQMKGADAVMLEWRDMLDDLKPLFPGEREWRAYIQRVPKPSLDNNSTVVLVFPDMKSKNSFISTGCLPAMLNYISEHGYDTTIEVRSK